MRRGTPWIASLMVVAGWTLSVSGSAAGEPRPDSGAVSDPASDPTPDTWRTLGLMRIRDMTPFGISRLDMLPAHAVRATPGTFALEVNASYQNTWALSENVRGFLTQRGIQRGELNQGEIDKILALPGDAYLVDGEFGVVDVTLHHRTTERLGFYATVPYFSFNTGFLDDTIESFHGTLGISNAAREFAPRNRFLAIADLEGTRQVVDRLPADDFGDPIFGTRFVALSGPRFNLIVEAAVKLAIVDPEIFVATGHEDFGVQISLQRFFTRNAFYASLAGVYFQTPEPGLADDGWIPTAVLGWETKMTRHTNFILQAYASRSVVQHTELDELSATKLQATLGLQWLYRGSVLRFGITENVANFDNTPDIGLNLSLGRIVFGKAR